MDLRIYYRKVREAEAKIAEPFAVVMSLETSDGGKPGVMSEVTRFSAAKQVAEGRARVATAEEAAEFHRINQDVKRAADEMATFNRMQVVVVPARTGVKGSKE